MRLDLPAPVLPLKYILVSLSRGTAIGSPRTTAPLEPRSNRLPKMSWYGSIVLPLHHQSCIVRFIHLVLPDDDVVIGGIFGQERLRRLLPCEIRVIPHRE